MIGLHPGPMGRAEGLRPIGPERQEMRRRGKVGDDVGVGMRQAGYLIIDQVEHLEDVLMAGF